MRNYLRFIAYVWRYKMRVVGSVVSSLLAVGLKFASVGVMFVTMHILLSMRLDPEGGASEMASKGIFQNRYGRAFIDYLKERAYPDSVFVRTLIVLGLGFLGVAAVRAVFDFLRRYLLQSASQRGWIDMTNQLFQRITRLSMRFFTHESLGKTMSTFGPDVGELRSGTRVISTRAIRDPFRLVAGLVITITISWRLWLVTFIAVPIAFCIIKVVGDRVRRYTKKTLEKRADIMKVVGESIQGAAVIKAYDAEAYQNTRFRKSSSRLLRYGLRRSRVRAAAGPITDLVYWACRLAVLLYGASLVLAERLTLGELGFFVFCVKEVYQPLEGFRNVNNEIQRCRAAAERVFALMDLEPEVQERPDAKLLPPHRVEIRFDHVHFAYDPPNEVIHDFDLAIRAGEVVAIVGENGSGKSTLVNLLLRFYDPTRGAIRIDGTDIRDVTLSSLRRQFGYVSQRIVLFNDTIRHNIAFGDTEYSDAQVEAAARAALAHDFIVNELPQGYETIVGEAGARLSGGQRQRIALARALLRDPRILILDEATSALDADAEERLQRELASFAGGRTVLLVAHRFSALRCADRIVVLADGRTEQVGVHDQLVATSPTYRNLYHKQSAVPEAEPAG